MSIFDVQSPSHAAGAPLDEDDINELSMLIDIREPGRLDRLPDDFQILDAKALNFPESADGYYDDDGYYHAEGVANGGQAIAVLQDDGTISIAFRGTNDSLDYGSIFSFRNNAYIFGFEDWLNSIADFAKSNDYVIENVVGKSLGGAATNMLYEERDVIGDGAFEDALFLGVASPKVTSENDGNILNFGFSNDYAFEWYDEWFGGGGNDSTNATDNFVYYNQEYAASNWNGFTDFSAHSFAAFEGAWKAAFAASDIDEDDLVIFADHHVIKTSQAISRIKDDYDDIKVLATDDTNYRIEGSAENEHIILKAGDDKITARGGDDQIEAGAGRDVIYGNWGDDRIDGEDGSDKIYGGNGRDIIEGGDDDDRIYGGRDEDWMSGGAGNDKILGQNGDDTIMFSSGNDLIYGGSGRDAFVFDANEWQDDGRSVIGNFEIDKDGLFGFGDAFSEAEFEAIKESAETTKWGHLKLQIDDEKTLILKNTSLEDLQALAEERGLDDWDELLFF